MLTYGNRPVSPKTYTDTTCLPLFAEVEKLNVFLPSPIAAPKSDKSSQKEDKPVQSDLAGAITEVRVFQRKTADLSNAVLTWGKLKMAEREGFEPSRSAKEVTRVCLQNGGTGLIGPSRSGHMYCSDRQMIPEPRWVRLKKLI